LKRTGRRAARYIKKKGARRAGTKELALYKARVQIFTKRRKNWPAKKERTKTKEQTDPN